MGSPEQAEALKNFTHTEGADPLQAGLKGGDAVQGALATVAATSAKQGTPEEARGARSRRLSGCESAVEAVMTARGLRLLFAAPMLGRGRSALRHAGDAHSAHTWIDHRAWRQRTTGATTNRTLMVDDLGREWHASSEC